MENVIAKMFQDFEQGKVSRRQIIQTLALMVTASGSAATAAAQIGTGFKAVSVNHISFDVPDYTKFRDFYSSLFGMEVKNDDGKQCHLLCGDTYITPRTRPGQKMPVIDHIAIGIENFSKDRVDTVLNSRGIKADWGIKPGPHLKPVVPTLHDSQGFMLQISSKDYFAG